MAEDLTTKVVEVRPVAIPDPKTGFSPGLAVDFTVGGHGPYTLRVPASGYTADAVKAAVEVLAQQIRRTLQQ